MLTGKVALNHVLLVFSTLHKYAKRYDITVRNNSILQYTSKVHFILILNKRKSQSKIFRHSQINDVSINIMNVVFFFHAVGILLTIFCYPKFRDLPIACVSCRISKAFNYRSHSDILIPYSTYISRGHNPNLNELPIVWPRNPVSNMITNCFTGILLEHYRLINGNNPL